MRFFDHVKEVEINGLCEIFAVNEKDNQSYLLRNVIISTSESSVNGFSLEVGSGGDKYTYRGNFSTRKGMEEFQHDIIRKIDIADKKNAAR